jgi:protein-S-isoprenylcysteine O-methyltransferase Ste14
VKGFSAFVSTFIWIVFILVWKQYEEKNLERKYGERYREYKKKTWF